MNNGGAVAGGLAAAAVLAWSDLSLAEVILWSAVPSFMAVLLVGVGIKEDKSQVVQQPIVLPSLSWAVLSTPMRRYLLY